MQYEKQFKKLRADLVSKQLDLGESYLYDILDRIVGDSEKHTAYLKSFFVNKIMFDAYEKYMSANSNVYNESYFVEFMKVEMSRGFFYL